MFKGTLRELENTLNTKDKITIKILIKVSEICLSFPV
jgi:hypothetical protein